MAHETPQRVFWLRWKMPSTKQPLILARLQCQLCVAVGDGRIRSGQQQHPCFSCEDCRPRAHALGKENLSHLAYSVIVCLQN